MSHLIEEYAKHCGVTIGEPILGSHFFPLPFSYYITIDTTSNVPANQYSYWPEVIELINKSKVQGSGWATPKIIRLCNKDNAAAMGEDLQLRDLSIKQANYILSNSRLHFGVDGPMAHIASSYKIPQVVLFSNSMPEYSGPVWGDKAICLKPQYKNGKPSFAMQEKELVVNTIFPDQIVNAAHGLVPSILHPSDIDIKHVGKLFHHRLSEVIPDFFHDIKELRGRLLNIRMDTNFNEEILEKWLQTNRCSIITDRPISLDLLRRYRTNIPFINFFSASDELPDEQYFRDFGGLGIAYKIYSERDDSEQFKQQLNRYFDFQFDLLDIPSEWPIEVSDKLKFKSNKRIYCKNGKFFSRAHMKSLDNSDNVIDNEDFISELDHFLIYESIN